MLTVTQQISSVVGLDASSFSEAVNDTLVSYGVTDIANATDIGKLRALAKVQAWQEVVNVTASEYDISRDSGESQVWDKRNQLHTNARTQLSMAQSDAERLGYVNTDSAYNTVSFGTVVYDDPYSITEDSA